LALGITGKIFVILLIVWYYARTIIFLILAAPGKVPQRRKRPFRSFKYSISAAPFNHLHVRAAANRAAVPNKAMPMNDSFDF